MKTDAVFRALNEELSRSGLEREIVICGGAALIALGIVSRATRDVDVLDPILDSGILSAASAVGKAMGLTDGWLNNGPRALTETLPQGWVDRCTEVFRGSHLRVRSLSRIDLIFSKLDAAASRVDDIRDLDRLKPTMEELEAAKEWTLAQDAAEIWPQIVDECLAELKRRLDHAKE
ncbi:MAG: hypothetical protein IT285_10040 [Bdellovibrionales bacterium]|nr:hypothetical protein [Bdellovibrionales bacterium]